MSIDPEELEILESGKYYVMELFKLLDELDRRQRRRHSSQQIAGVAAGIFCGGEENQDERWQ
jgi:hypothetical protein